VVDISSATKAALNIRLLRIDGHRGEWSG